MVAIVRRKDLYIFEMGDRLEYYIDGEKFTGKHERVFLEEIFTRHRFKEANIFLGPKYIRSEILSIRDIDKKYVGKYIDKEIYKRSGKDFLVDYRYIDENNIIISKIKKDVVKFYLSIYPALTSLSSKLDFIVDSYETEENNFSLLIFEDDFLEIYTKKYNEYNILYREIYKNDETDLIVYELEEVLFKNDINLYLDNFNLRSISLSGEKFKEVSLEKLF